MYDPQTLEEAAHDELRYLWGDLFRSRISPVRIRHGSPERTLPPVSLQQELVQWLQTSGVDMTQSVVRCIAAAPVRAAEYVIPAPKGQVAPAPADQRSVMVGRALSTAEEGQELQVVLMLGIEITPPAEPTR